MKCPLLVANELSPSNTGCSKMYRTVNLRRLCDAILYCRNGEGYENPRSYIKGSFRPNPLKEIRKQEIRGHNTYLFFHGNKYCVP
jgi:hypothetical protein